MTPWTEILSTMLGAGAKSRIEQVYGTLKLTHTSLKVAAIGLWYMTGSLQIWSLGRKCFVTEMHEADAAASCVDRQAYW